MPEISLQSQLSQIASLAYGSGRTEKTHGGAGNIGLIDGHVVKFNTHHDERGGKVTDAMRLSCNQLRAKLNELATEMLRGAGLGGTSFEKEIKSIRSQLGLSADGTTVVSKGLLDRKSVATVVNKIAAKTHQDYWTGDHTRLAGLASAGKKTDFASVARTRVGEMTGRYMEAHAQLIDTMVSDIGGKQISDANATILKTCFRRVVEGALTEKGTVTEADMKGPGSTFDILNQLSAKGQFNLRMAIYANSMPPQEANAVLRAYALVPDDCYGTLETLCAVSSRLAKLPPEKFTVGNVLKLARPDLPVPPELRGRKEPLAMGDVNRILQPISNFLNDVSEMIDNLVAQGKDNDPKMFVLSKLNSLCMSGVSLQNMKTCLAHPEKFSFKMVPSVALLSGDNNSAEGVQQALDGFVKDVSRIKPNISIVGNGGETVYQMPKEMHSDAEMKSRPATGGKTPLEEFASQIRSLCGEQNTAQQRLVLFAMSQNAMLGESFMNACSGYGKAPPPGMQFELRRDDATGDVLMTRRTPPEAGFEFSQTVRFGADGSQSVVELRTAKENLHFETLRNSADHTSQAKTAAKALNKKFNAGAARRSEISDTLKTPREIISAALGKFREDIRKDLSEVAGRMVFNRNPGGKIVVTDEDLDRYRELLVQHDGDSVDALYDLLEEKGVSKKNLKPRFAYPDVGRKPENREEELQFSSGAPGMWNQQEEDLEENLKIDDVQDQIGSVMDSSRLKPASWLVEGKQPKETSQGILSLNFERMLEIQRLENSLMSADETLNL